MKEQVFEKRTCPKCGRTYTERPALSRSDNETLICPDCGTREALESMGISVEEDRSAVYLPELACVGNAAVHPRKCDASAGRRFL